MRTEYLNVPFEIKAVDDDGHIEGYGSIFKNVDLGLDRVEPGAFKRSLRKRRKSDPLPILWQHDGAEPIGIWERAEEDRVGLFMEGQLNLSRDSGQADVPTAWRARTLAKQRAVKGLSIGFFAKEYHFEEQVRVLTEVDLIEVSMVTFPMNPLAQLIAAKGSSVTNKDFVRALIAEGLSREAAEAIRAQGIHGLRRAQDNDRQADDLLEGLRNLKSQFTI